MSAAGSCNLGSEKEATKTSPAPSPGRLKDEMT